MLVTMRGESGEFNPWQVPMGQNTEKLLATAGVLTFPVGDSNQLESSVEQALNKAFEAETATAVLISQQILGVKSFND